MNIHDPNLNYPQHGQQIQLPLHMYAHTAENFSAFQREIEINNNAMHFQQLQALAHIDHPQKDMRPSVGLPVPTTGGKPETTAASSSKPVKATSKCPHGSLKSRCKGWFLFSLIGWILSFLNFLMHEKLFQKYRLRLQRCASLHSFSHKISMQGLRRIRWVELFLVFEQLETIILQATLIW